MGGKVVRLQNEMGKKRKEEREGGREGGEKKKKNNQGKVNNFLLDWT